MKKNTFKANKTAAEALQITTEQAQQIINDKINADRQACADEINKVEREVIAPILEKYGFSKVIEGRFVGGQIQTGIALVKK